MTNSVDSNSASNNKAATDSLKPCRKCEQSIPARAKVCHYCQSSQSIWSRLPKFLEILALMATTTAIGLMVWSNLQTKEEIELTRKSMAYSDSSLAIAVSQLAIARNAYENEFQASQLAEKTYKDNAKQYFSDKKPILGIQNPICKAGQGVVRLDVTLFNSGRSTASNISTLISWMDLTSSKIIVSETTQYDDLSPNGGLVIPNEFSPADSFIVKFDINWSWYTAPH